MPLLNSSSQASAIDFASFLVCTMLVMRGAVNSTAERTDDYYGHLFWYQAIGEHLSLTHTHTRPLPICHTPFPLHVTEISVFVSFLQFIGLAAFLLSRFVNDHLVLSAVANTEVIVAEHNLGAATVQAAAGFASAIIIYGASVGPDPGDNFWMGFAGTMVYWPISQMVLNAYIIILNQCTRMKHPKALKAIESFRESQGLERGGANAEAPAPVLLGGFTYLRAAASDNVACGLAVGGELIAVAVLLARDSVEGSAGWSLSAYFIWVGVAVVVVMPAIHVVIDLLVLRGVKYTENILIHKNWGAGLLVGTLKVCIALMLSATYQYECEASSYQAGDPGFCNTTVLDTSGLGHLLDETSIPQIFQVKTIINLCVLPLVFLVAKALTWARLAIVEGFSFSISKQLANHENNAIAITLAGKCLGLTLVMTGLLACPDEYTSAHVGTLVGWLAIGIVFMEVAILLNDLILIPKVMNAKELLADNVAIACLEAGSFVSCGLITQACVAGSTDNFWAGLLLTLIYWSIAQVLFILFVYAYRALTAFDDLEQFHANNVAVGLSSGLQLISFGVVLNSAVSFNGSIYAVLPIVFISMILLLILRIFIDKALLPTRDLDKEIAEDRNWGLALIEGLAGISFALTLRVLLPYEPTLNCETWSVADQFFALPR